ncbi:hypothetical protein GF322_04700 [Candidatus Dependentiae bacterium]|nr:hypothetical protein [Candidatus Dependentiae bacterium]
MIKKYIFLMFFIINCTIMQVHSQGGIHKTQNSNHSSIENTKTRIDEIPNIESEIYKIATMNTDPIEKQFKLKLIQSKLDFLENYIKDLQEQLNQQLKMLSVKKDENETIESKECSYNEWMPILRRISIGFMGTDLAICKDKIKTIQNILNTTKQKGLEKGKQAFIEFIQTDDIGWTTQDKIKNNEIKESELNKYDENMVAESYKIKNIQEIGNWPEFKGLLLQLINNLKKHPNVMKKFSKHFNETYYEIANTIEYDISTKK